MAAAAANPVVHVELPVIDLERAIRFYETLFDWRFEPPVAIHDSRMAFLPVIDGADGASLALSQGDAHVPTSDGAIVYFRVADIDATLTMATALDAAIIFPKTAVGPAGFVAEIRDSEGNRIALQTL